MVALSVAVMVMSSALTRSLRSACALTWVWITLKASAPAPARLAPPNAMVAEMLAAVVVDRIVDAFVATMAMPVPAALSASSVSASSA